MVVARKVTPAVSNVHLHLFPDWNPYKKSRNTSYCALGWCTTLLLSLLAGVMIMKFRKESYLYGRCKLHGFSDGCHICYTAPFAEGLGGCKMFSKDTCNFVVLATAEDGYSYKAPYEAEYGLKPWTENNTLEPTNPAFQCCPEDYNCCDWFDSDALSFCDVKCKAGRPHGWPCRFRANGNATAVDVEYREYWHDEQAIRNGQAAVLAVFSIVAILIRDPCELRGRKLLFSSTQKSPTQSAAKKPKIETMGIDDDEL